MKSVLSDQDCRDIYAEAMKTTQERRQLQLVRSIEAKLLEHLERNSNNREKICEQSN